MPSKCTTLAKLTMAFQCILCIYILFLSTYELFLHTVVSSCITFMPSCIFHRSIPSLKSALSSCNGFCCIVKTISSISLSSNSAVSDENYINFVNNPIIQLSDIAPADIASIFMLL